MLEYARTAMFMWMFIEGLYLHNVVTVTVFQGKFPHTLYAIMGWGAPAVMTVMWAAFTAKYRNHQKYEFAHVHLIHQFFQKFIFYFFKSFPDAGGVTILHLSIGYWRVHD